jgi:magnesium chelatase family protein
MLARRLPGILSRLDDEAAPVTRIHWWRASCLHGTRACARRPTPHHRVRRATLRRQRPAPGEASLAHRGVLYLDEPPEFRWPVLEALREPLEDGVVSVVRVGGRALPRPASS